MITLDLSILNQKGTPMFYSDTLALRPAFGIAGRIFIAIDSPYGIFRDTGSAWDQIAGSGGGGGIGGSGTATQIAFFSASTTLSSSANLFWDNTNARLGVNTNVPSASLDIHSTVQSIIQANNTTLGNSFLLFLLQDVGKWQLGNVYNAGANYFRIRDQLNSLERFTIQNTGEIDFLGYSSTLNTLTGITGTTPSAVPNSGFTNDFTFNSGISTSASVNAIGLLVDNGLNYSGANTINATSYNASGLFRIGLTFGSAAASITYTQGATAQIRALTSNQVQYIQNGNNSGTISHYANIQILGDNKSGSGLTTFTNRYGLLINDFADFAAGNTYTNRWGIYQQGLNENNFFAGKVGMGAGYSPSTYQLDVIGTGRVYGVFRQQTTSGNNYFELVANANATNPYITALKSGTFEYKIEFGASFGSQFVAGAGVLIGDAGSNSVNTKVKGMYATDVIETASGRMYLASTTNNFLQFTQVGVTGRGAIGYATGTDYLQIRTNAATDLLTGTLSTIFDRIGSVGIGGITTVNLSAILQADSTTKGFLPPRMTTTQKNAISTPAAGLVIYDTTLNKLCVYTTAWETVTSI
jgi:hypothetical protein